jgi:hypothetical protein
MNRCVVEDRSRPAQNRNKGDELEDLVELETLVLYGRVGRRRLEEEDALEEEEDGKGLQGGVVGEDLRIAIDERWGETGRR